MNSILRSSFILLTTALIATALASFAAEKIFTPPDAAFVLSSDEQNTRISVAAESADEAQKVIDAARAASPGSFLIIDVQGTLKVEANPLRLGSKMCLQLAPASAIKADEDATAPSLISIVDAEFVSVKSAGPGLALIDGGKKQLVGISVTGGSRLNFDQLSIMRCGVAGFDYKGKEATAVNQAASVTRSEFEANGDGLRVDVTAGFQCLDNIFKNQTGTALVINSLTSVVAGNEFSGNQAAIVSSSDRGVIAQNRIADSAALDITSAGPGQLVTENICTAKDLKIKLAGSTQQLFRNHLEGNATIASESKDIFLIGNKGLSVDPASSGLKLFNPPTYRDPHTNPVIVAGMGRFDLPEIIGGKGKKVMRKPCLPWTLRLRRKL
jgi:hypothetical protein